MEAFLVAILILAAIFGIELQYIYNKILTPPDLVYLGTVHWPSDYFYYLSQFIQGQNSFLTSTMLFTPERLKPVYVGWQNVLTGKILMAAGFDVITSYQIAVSIYLGLFLFLSYKLISHIFPDHFARRILSLFFFITSTSMFKVIKTGSFWDLSYFSHWYNLGSALSRFGPTPHHLVAYSLGVFVLLVVIIWVQNNLKKNIYLLALFAAGFLQASINPVAWGLTSLAVMTTSAIFVFKSKRFSYSAPALLLLLSGILPSIYVKAVFAITPYNLSSAWESAQQLKMTPLWLFYDSGLVVIFAFFGINGFLKKTTFPRILLLSFIIWALFFYLSGIPEKAGISNARFWPSQVYIVWAVLACNGVFSIAERIKVRKKFTLSILLAIYIFSLIPTYYAQYKELLTDRFNNAFYFVQRDVYQLIVKSGEISDKDDVFLVVWPFNESFPALTGRKTLFGFELFTINHREKTKDGFDIIDGKMEEDLLKRTLNKYRIKYLLMYTDREYFRKFSFFKPVYSNPTLTLYSVDI